MTKDRDTELKKKIGNKIRSLRLNKDLTQADVCGDEAELTIRQLARIENGYVFPSLSKLVFLAQKLKVPVQQIVAVEEIEIPKRCLELKHKLVHSHTYGDEKRMSLHQEMFDEIYENFYDSLPEDEQLLVEVLQVQLDVYGSKDVTFALSLLEEYFHQILKKKKYSYNDLLIINLYFFCCAIGLEDKSYFDELAQKVIEYIDYSNSERVYLLERILINILVQVKIEDYLVYTSVFRGIMESAKSFQHKPVIYAFEAKYYLYAEDNREKCALSYHKAIEFAKMLNDDVLVENLIKEKETDLVT